MFAKADSKSMNAQSIGNFYNFMTRSFTHRTVPLPPTSTLVPIISRICRSLSVSITHTDFALNRTIARNNMQSKERRNDITGRIVGERLEQQSLEPCSLLSRTTGFSPRPQPISHRRHRHPPLSWKQELAGFGLGQVTATQYCDSGRRPFVGEYCDIKPGFHSNAIACVACVT